MNGTGITMQRKLLFFILLLCPCVASANPVNVDGQSLLAFWIVAFWALIVESGIATLILIRTGITVVPFFQLLAFGNLTVFLFAFYPLTDEVSLWLLEFGVIAVDALVIMILAKIPFLEGTSVTWLKALIASACGNAASYFVGVIAISEPWFTK